MTGGAGRCCDQFCNNVASVSVFSYSFGKCFFLALSAIFLPVSIQLTKAHRQGHMVKVDWLDRLTFREIEMINEVRPAGFCT